MFRGHRKLASSGTSLIFTGVVDGPLTGGIPKVIEFYACSAIQDLGIYGVERAANGASSTGTPQYEFPSGASLAAGGFIYLAYSGSTYGIGFQPFFQVFDKTLYTSTSQAAEFNGNDALILYENGQGVDFFGVVGEDGTGTPWDYKNGYAYRVDATDSCQFHLGDWDFSGANSFAGTTTNQQAMNPFPIGSYSGTCPIASCTGSTSSTMFPTSTGTRTRTINQSTWLQQQHKDQ